MAPAERTGGDSTNDHEGATNGSVRELLLQHFPQLSSAADLLFEPGAHEFGIFGYSATISNVCGRVGGEGENSHGAAVVWVAASFLMCQKLIRTGSALDDALSSISPAKLDYAILYKYCGKESSTGAYNCDDGQVGDEAVGKSSPTRASSSLTITDIQLMYQANMRLLVESNLYEAYTRVISRLAEEILATTMASVAVHSMLGIACVASTAFTKTDVATHEVNLPSGCEGGETVFPKCDVSDDLLQTLTGPLYGHHPLIAITAAACGNLYDSKTGDIDWPESLAKHEENLIYLFDWDVAGRNDSLTSRVAAMQKPGMNEVEPDLDSSAPLSANPLSTKDHDARVSSEKNRVGSLQVRWDTETENELIKGRVRKLARHSGWLCRVPDMVREIVLATTSYYQYDFWPSGDWTSVQSLWYDLAATIGAMERGWMLDHDTEADIGEHNASNWLCKTCAQEWGLLQQTTRRTQAEPMRSVRAQRLAWGPISYFYYSRRHSGLARRVYSNKFSSLPGIQWGAVTRCSDYLQPIPAPESPFGSVGSIILHLLRVAGLTVDSTNLSQMCKAMPAVVDPSTAGMCANCTVDGICLEMMMYGNGVMVMAAMLPEPTRRKFVWEMEGYGGRAFPLLYSRLLNGCTCSSYWLQEVLQLGYNWSWSPCGSDTCFADEGQVVVPVPEESGSEWLKKARTSENLQTLTSACKVQFESMPAIRDQIRSGHLNDSWSYLSCAGQVKSMLASKNELAEV